jgi:hypothetical protein
VLAYDATAISEEAMLDLYFSGRGSADVPPAANT